ncbi:MAG: hypothetical protein WD342_11065 [Verrucomicrobiales bacterium]
MFYGVGSDEAITLRLLGVPRRAAEPLARKLAVPAGETLPATRRRLAALSQKEWVEAMGGSGIVYHRVWQIMEGKEE